MRLPAVRWLGGGKPEEGPRLQVWGSASTAQSWRMSTRHQLGQRMASSGAQR
jgi:hypothetical protein